MLQRNIKLVDGILTVYSHDTLKIIGDVIMYVSESIQNRGNESSGVSMFSRLYQEIKTRWENMRTANDLLNLTDRDLMDIGITKADIPAILKGQRVREN